MADSPNSSPQGQTPNPESTSPEGSEKTAEQLESEFLDRMMGRMDTWFDNKVKSFRTNSTSRNGRTSLPSVLADIVFGKPKE